MVRLFAVVSELNMVAQLPALRLPVASSSIAGPVGGQKSSGRPMPLRFTLSAGTWTTKLSELVPSPKAGADGVLSYRVLCHVRPRLPGLHRSPHELLIRWTGCPDSEDCMHSSRVKSDTEGPLVRSHLGAR